MPGKPDGEIHIVQWESLEEESTEIARYAQHLIQQRGYKPGDILILCPRRLIGYGIRDALVEIDVPVHSYFHEEALEDDRSQRTFALLTLLVNREDRVSLRYWLGAGSPTWLANQYATLRTHCEQTGLSPWHTLEQLNGGVLELPHTGDILARFRELLIGLQAIYPLSGMELIDHLFPADQQWAAQLREASLQSAAEEIDAATLLDHLRTVITQPEIPESEDFVRIMSLHKSKGLTSKVVIVVGSIEGLIPSGDDSETPQEQEATRQEQRRLFYVAITRATEILAISSAIRMNRQLAHKVGAILRPGGGRLGRTIASTFIAQLGPQALASVVGSVWRDHGYV